MRVFVVGLLVACGPGLAQENKPHVVRPGVPPPADARGFRKLLDGEVMNGGLWFADASCQTRFGHYGKITPDAFDAFAGCVAGLHLRASGRENALDDTSVLTDDAGFEIEAHVAKGRLDFIGFSGRVPGVPDLPSITPQTLESLRASGDPNATLGADEAAALPEQRAATRTEHLRLCIGAEGQVTNVIPAVNTSVESAKAFAALARSWTFKPFVVAGTPMPVCAIVGFQYPATPREPKRDRLPIPARRSKAGNIFFTAVPQKLEALRQAGERFVFPDDGDKVHLGGKRVVGSFKLCLDETGHYEEGTLLQSTGLPRYDAKIARELMQWVYKPFVVDGVAVPVCGAFTFVYSQR